MERSRDEKYLRGAKRVRNRSTIRTTILACVCVCLCTAQALHAAGELKQAAHEPYSLEFALEPGLQVITFHTQQGRVRVTLPQALYAGQAYSGTVEALPEGASTATSTYTIEIAGARVAAKTRAIHFSAPEAGRVPMILRDFWESEIARFDLTISPPGPLAPAVPGVWKGDKFRVPDMVEVTAPVPLLGPFDGNSATTGFKFRGVLCEVLTEAPGVAMARCLSDRGGPLPAGPAHYELTKGEAKAEGDTRAVSVELSGVPRDLANGKRVKVLLTVTGLGGLDRDTEIRLENLTPTLASIDPNPPLTYFLHNREYFFIQPKDVKAGGTYITERSVMGIQRGDPIRFTANLVIPTAPHEAVEQILRTPRKDLSKYPGVEHSEALTAFGDAAFPLVAEFLTDGELAWEAEYVLFRDKLKAAPLVFPRIPQMGGQPLSLALGAYLDLAQRDPDFPYKRELHDVSRAVLEKGKLAMDAIFALAVVGTEADMPLLEKIYRGKKEHMTTAAAYDLVMNAAEAALARMGSAEHIRNIKERLSIVVNTPADAENFNRAANDAVFADNKVFLPELCAHLKDRGWWFGDYGISSASGAAAAVNAIARAKTPGERASACPNSQ
jgi:hypothetical protein